MVCLCALSGPKMLPKEEPSRSNSTDTLVALVIAAALTCVGLLAARNYGISVDEYVQRLYAQQTVQSYLGQLDPRQTVADLRFYGPFFSVLSLLVARALTALPLGLEQYQAAHFTYYLSFALACVSVYCLIRFFTRWPFALVGAAFFASQPLLFGHAFINPKDMPMLGFFTASMALGMNADSLLGTSSRTHSNAETLPSKPHRKRSHEGRKPQNWWSWAVLGLMIVSLVLSIVDISVGRWTLSASIWEIRGAYEGKGLQVINTLFHIVAQDAYKTPLKAYLAKWLVAYVCLASLWLSALIVGVTWAASRSILRKNPLVVAREEIGWAVLVVAGAVLGMSMSIRVGAVFAGFLVGSLLVWSKGLRALVPAAIYAMVAVIVSMATWPFLWGDPLARFWTALRMMADFPHEVSVLYKGVSYLSTALPPDFVPGLMLFQFTLPLFPLAAFGLVRSMRKFRRPTRERRLLWILSLWFAVPVLITVVLRPTLYGNFRQLLFITPPLFVFAGLGLEAFVGYLPWPRLGVLLTVAILAPGIAAILRLHPYEYVYYNALVGGTRGAFGSYEMDYWCTSLREAALDVNRIAQQDDDVAVLFQDTSQVAPFARPDLHVFHARTVNDVLVTHPDEVLACSPSFGFRHADDWATLAVVGRDGAIFAKVMQGPGP